MSATLLLPDPLRECVAGLIEPRAADVDAGRIDVRDGLRSIQEKVLRGEAAAAGEHVERIAETIATAAWSDLTTAFSLWCHRMTLLYLTQAPDPAIGHELIPLLERLDRVGSTGLAPAMAFVVSGTPLPVTARRENGGLVVDGRIRWASNLFGNEFVIVTGASLEGGTVVVALAGGQDGVEVEPYPELVALQGTASSSITLAGARVPADRVLSWDLRAFVMCVRPTFLVLQSAFCWGLARRALDEVDRAVRTGSILDPDRGALEARSATIAETLRAAARHQAPNIRSLVAARLESARLATDAVALELRAVGSRAYARSSPTARRLREAAFLPIQAPTEAQLREELARAS